MNFPDPGAHISVRTKSGVTHAGVVDAGHTWAKDGNVLCLANGKAGAAPDFETGDVLWTYISKDSIESFTWDCLL
jgi:hypothetical protein